MVRVFQRFGFCGFFSTLALIVCLLTSQSIAASKDDVSQVVVEGSAAAGIGTVQQGSSDPEAAATDEEKFGKGSGFAAFNARHESKWQADFNGRRGKVKLLYGAVSKRYAGGPESAAKGFLRENSDMFGLSEELSELKTKRVDKSPAMDGVPARSHVRFQQTYHGIPVVGAQVLVHLNVEGQVTMVQNDSVALEVVNQDLVEEKVAVKTAQDDLRAELGEEAAFTSSKAEKQLVPRAGGYAYVWKVTIPTRNPFGYWVYQIDAESGAIVYKANEITSLRSGKGKAYKTNADWHASRVSGVPLKNMFTSAEGNPGYLWGLHAAVLDNGGNHPFAPDFNFSYFPSSNKDYFDAAHAYYQMNTIWDWWDKKVVRKYSRSQPDYFYDLDIPVIVNVEGMCNAFYSPDLLDGYPGFAFGDEDACDFGSEDLVNDIDVFRHEFTHAMMDWSGFGTQFGGPLHYYGRAMGEGNADWYSFLYTPKDPYLGDVASAWDNPSYIRNLDNTRMYPRDVDYPAWGVPEEHYTGEIWGGYLLDAYRTLKGKALPYIYLSNYYFSSTGGHMSGQPDFFDAIKAQAAAELDITGKLTSTVKMWGSQASRGINGYRRAPYSHASDYFNTGMAGSDSGAALYFSFPPNKVLTTSGNMLISGDVHEYIINMQEPDLDLTAMITASASNALVNPTIRLYTLAGDLLATAAPSASNKATLSYANLPAGLYVVTVTGQASAPARGYYKFKVKAL